MDTAAKIPNPVKTLQEEAVCAICLDYFTDPVSIRCGHNFCRVCITQLWFRQQDEDREELEWEEEEEEDIEEAVGASVGLETPVVDDDLERDMEEEFEGPVGNRESNWDSVWGEEEEEEEEEQDVVDMQEEHLSWEDEEEVLAEGEEEELDHATPLSPPPEPQRCFTCPQCRKSFHRWSFRPNLQLANMVQVIRQMHPNPAQGSHVNEQAMCPKHQEALKLFCQVDEEAICVVCRESRRHKQHSVVPVEEVVQGYKAKLQGHLEPLRKHLGELQDMKAEEERRLAELNSQMDLELAGAASEFGQLTEFLEEEQANLQWLIQEMYKAKMGRARANVNHFSEQFTKLSGLLAEVQERSQQGGLLLLQETLKKCQEVLQQPPNIFPPEMSQPLGDDFRTDAIVRKMSRVFCKDTRVDLKPDPDAAPLAPNLSTDSCDPPGGEAAGGF